MIKIGMGHDEQVDGRDSEVDKARKRDVRSTLETAVNDHALAIRKNHHLAFPETRAE